MMAVVERGQTVMDLCRTLWRTAAICGGTRGRPSSGLRRESRRAVVRLSYARGRRGRRPLLARSVGSAGAVRYLRSAMASRPRGALPSDLYNTRPWPRIAVLQSFGRKRVPVARLRSQNPGLLLRKPSDASRRVTSQRACGHGKGEHSSASDEKTIGPLSASGVGFDGPRGAHRRQHSPGGPASPATSLAEAFLREPFLTSKLLW